MESTGRIKSLARFITVVILIFLTVMNLSAQNYTYGVYISPLISWFRTDIDEVKNEGSRAGINLFITAERDLTKNWSFTMGLGYITSGGRLKSSQQSVFRFPDFTATVAAGEPVIYHIQYITVPVGLRIKTEEIGYIRYFAEFGLDPKVVVSGKADIPSAHVKGERAMTEIRRFNAGYHLLGGIDYSINGSTSLILGLEFENNFFDITKDIDGQKTDRTTQKLLKFIFGVNF
ncbi:MAG: porin family protein [Bacteroidota bacterium]|nr:porin family protein [Bacteroidota bacterium]